MKINFPKKNTFNVLLLLGYSKINVMKALFIYLSNCINEVVFSCYVSHLTQKDEKYVLKMNQKHEEQKWPTFAFAKERGNSNV